MAVERILGIVTDIVRHNDRYNIVRLYTRSRGMISFLSPAGTGRSGRARNARLQLLSVVESDVNFREPRQLQSLGAITLHRIWRDLYFNPVKSSIVMFLSEFLTRYLRESLPEPLLWDFIVETIANLDLRKGKTGNFHLSFLIGFLQFAGIAPDMGEYERGDYFDMRAGMAVAERPLHRDFLYPSEAEFLNVLLRMNVKNDSVFKFKKGERKIILEKLLHYYSIHFPGTGNLKSPEILSEVFT